MTEIFVSHATADRALAKLLVDFLKEAIGVPRASIFCSSLPGHGVPFTEDFNAYMHDQVQEPKLVIHLITEAYVESPFCMMELGASWSRSLRAFPVVVPPMSFDVVTRTLGLRQAWRITDHDGLIGLRSTVAAAVSSLEHRTEHDWEEKRQNWRRRLSNIRKKLATGSKVSQSAYEDAQSKIIEQAAEIAKLNKVVAETKDLAAVLRQSKEKIAFQEGQIARLTYDAIKKFDDAQREKTTSQRTRILTIEPDPMIALDVFTILSGADYVVIGNAASRVEALDMTLRMKPDLVISETKLGEGMSGVDAVKFLVERKLLSVSLFLTAYPEELLRGDRPENTFLVTKPYDKDKLLSEVAEAARLARVLKKSNSVV